MERFVLMLRGTTVYSVIVGTIKLVCFVATSFCQYVLRINFRSKKQFEVIFDSKEHCRVGETLSFRVVVSFESSYITCSVHDL